MLLLLLLLADVPPEGPPPASDAETIVLLGGTMVERAQEYGAWEAAIRLARPDQPVRVRNLAWSGDTVWAESRGRFDKPDAGYKRLIDEVTALQPDVLVFGYGTAELLDDVPVERFAAQLRTLVADLPAARRYFVTPSAQPAERHQRLAAYRGALTSVADELDATLIDVSDVPVDASTSDDGLHWNAAGYARSATALMAAFGTERTLPTDLQQQLQTAIREKNRLVFHRHRPQNTTYLFLFRKHEQGQNAGEVPQFEASIERAEAALDARVKQLAGQLAPAAGD